MEDVQGSNVNETAAANDVIAAAAAAAPPGDDASTTLLVGAHLENAIQEIVSLGFSRSQATVAMEASCNNPDRAVHYLTNVNCRLTPAENLTLDEEAGSCGSDGTEHQPNRETPSQESDDDPLLVFASQPQFSQIRQMLNSNPRLMNSFLQQVKRSNPRLHQAISDDRERFLQTLNEPIPAEVGDAGGGEGGVAFAPYVGSVVLSDVEHRAVERLMELGFSESFVVQAYFACEKNEELTADFLLSQDPE